ncbi:uncharacterized protein LOC129806196 [Phlebotomus papatasi]|uniref:uncharacterized protein LOC129806196 n=1 Tax=Phlebotomus papatasi TaxID=29031 RepID=UPI00248459EE|nr:uncharacterized protein LOC129806196 [Phlebotomus papatasi]
MPQVAAQEAQEVQQTREVGQKPKPFVLGGDERRKWRLWEASFGWYANNIELSKMSGSKQVTIFLSCLGPEIIDILDSFDLTENQMTQLSTVKERFRAHFNAQDNPAYEAWVFNKSDQEEGETFTDYVTKLKAQVKRCSFTETGSNLVNRLVRDRIISGVRSETLRTKLLEEHNLSLEKAVSMGKAHEAAVSQNKKIAEDFREVKSEVNLVKRGAAAQKRKTCAWCGREHKPRECPAYGKTCGKCGKLGHFKDVCRSKASARTRKVEKEIDDSESDCSEEKVVDSLKVFQVGGKADGDRWTEKVMCGRKRIKVAIDTGAQCSVMSAKTANLIGVGSVQKSPIKRLVTYSGDKILVKGRAFVDCVIRGETFRISFQVVDKDCATILDGDSAVKAKLITRIQQVTADRAEDSTYGFEPLRDLVNSDEDYKWKSEHQKAFDTIKKSLQEAPVLQYFKVGDPVVLSVDSSSRAYGAVLMQNGLPVAYATRSLTSAEQNYPQLEKEAGAIRFGCTKFHSYIWGAAVTIETDHKPLEVIFRKPMVDAPPRLRRILYDVKPYAPKVVYKPGKEIPVADALSRICASEEATSEEILADEREVYAISCLEKSAEIRYKNATLEDKTLQDLMRYIKTGWPDHANQVKQSVRSYFTFKEELSEYEGIVYKGEKIVIPEAERATLLKLIHKGHNGINSSIRLAREFLYWPGMAADIKNFVEKCRVCQQTQAAKQKEEIFLKKIPEYPFQIVASDLFHFATYDFVLLVDSFSGFYEFKKLPEASSEEVIRFLKEKFALLGCPEELHTDGGPQYSSKAFTQFARDWGFKHEKSSPGFPRANGLAERYVQKAKKLIKKCSLSGEDIHHALLVQRNVPKENLGSPMERLMGRRTRTNLCAAKELLSPKDTPNVTEMLQKCREKQKVYADRGAKRFKELKIQSRVRMQNTDGSWSSGTVKEKKGERSYVVVLDDGRELWRNSHFIEPTKSAGPIIPDRFVKFPDLVGEAESTEQTEVQANAEVEEGLSQQPRPNGSQIREEQPGPSTGRYVTRSGREVKPPEKLNL